VEAAALGQLLRIRRDGNLHNVLLVNAKGVLPVAQTVFQSTLRARRRNREEFLQRLRRDVARLLRESPHFAPGDRVYLFGSRATDAWGGHSDTDLLAVLVGQGSQEPRKDAVFRELSRIADDILTVTDGEEARYVESGSGFWEQVFKDRILIGEVAPCRDTKRG